MMRKEREMRMAKKRENRDWRMGEDEEMDLALVILILLSVMVGGG